MGLRCRKLQDVPSPIPRDEPTGIGTFGFGFQARTRLNRIKEVGPPKNLALNCPAGTEHGIVNKSLAAVDLEPYSDGKANK